MKDLKLKNIRIITKSKPDYSGLFSTIWKKGSPIKNEFGKTLHLLFTSFGLVAGFIQFYFLLPELTILQIPFAFVLAPIQMAILFWLLFLIAVLVLRLLIKLLVALLVIFKIFN